MTKHILFLLMFSMPVQAANLSMTLSEPDNKPVQFAAITLTPLDQSLAITKQESTDSAMKQIDEQFEPYVLVVQTGSEVSFPNVDNIKHHVYSFSDAKTFELELYDEFTASPVLFDKAGIVELGCNIHDWMLAYVYVTDAPYFATTDNNGKINLTIPDGEYQIAIWHPNLDAQETALSKTIRLSGDTFESWKLSFALEEQFDFSTGFDDY